MSAGKIELFGRNKMSSYDIFELLESIVKETAVPLEQVTQMHDAYSNEIGEQGLKAPSKGNKANVNQNNDVDEDDGTIIDTAKEEIKDEEYKKIKKEPVKLDLSKSTKYNEFTDNVNLLRSAPSLGANEQLKVFFNELSGNEKKCLYVFIKSLIDVTINNVDGKSAHAPRKFNLIIEDPKSVQSSKPKETSKPKAASKPGEDEKPSQETPAQETPAQVDDRAPIVVGEAKQDKNSILKIIYSNK
jgi:hypothetical protein